jgi:hypothetical protein
MAKFTLILVALTIASITASNTTKTFFYYISTKDGLIGHLRQLYDIWLASRESNRSIHMVGFHSEHNQDASTLHICDIFVLTSDIVCIPNTKEEIYNSSQCVRPINPDQQVRNPGEVNISTINFATIECLTGFYRLFRTGISPETFLPFVRSEFIKYPYFTDKYLDLHRKALLSLNLMNEDYWVVHWRRGDELTRRCVYGSGFNDEASNCEDEKKLTETIHDNMMKHTNHTTLKVYLATNEQNPSRLQYLRNQNYLLLSNFTDDWKGKINTLTSLDVFVVELTLMCNTKYFMAWGVSTIPQFLMAQFCRSTKLFKDKLTLINNKIADSLPVATNSS